MSDTELRQPAQKQVTTTPWYLHGIDNLVVVLLVTLGGWYLLADPKTSPLDLYPLPFNAGLFWALLFVVWAGFNLEFAWFDKLAQPVKGAAIAGPPRFSPSSSPRSSASGWGISAPISPPHGPTASATSPPPCSCCSASRPT